MSVARRWLGRFGNGLKLLVNSLSRLVYVVLVTVFAVVLWLLFTTSGAQWLADRAAAEEERLHLEVTGGSLWNGLEVQSVRWRDEGLDVAVSSAELRWNHLCLLQRRVCLDLASVDGVEARVDTEAMPAAEPDAAAGADEAPADLFPLPVNIAFPDVRLQQVDIRVDGHRARWSDLRLEGALEGETLSLRQVNWETILVELAQGEEDGDPVEDAEASGPGFLETGWQALELPEVALPLTIVLDDLRLHEIQVVQGEDAYSIDRVGVAGELRESRAQLRHLEIVHPQGQLRADGSLTMSGDWPVDLELAAKASDLPEVGEVELDAELWNSVGDLEMRLQVRGPGTLNLEGAVAPGQDDMPMDVRVDWDALGWPLDSRATVAVRDGNLALTGDLSDYSAEFDAAVSGEDIPEGRWQASVRGDLQQARVESLRGDLLDGFVEITGEAAWHPGIKWDADVTLQGLAAHRIVEQAPQGVTGTLRTSGEVTEGAVALDVDVRELRGRVEGRELNLAGGVRRPAGGAWELRDIVLRTGDSSVRVSGQIGEQTLDVEGVLDVTDIGAFLAGAEGAVRGEFAAGGTLTAPDLVADLEGEGFSHDDLGSVGRIELDADVTGLGERRSRLRLAVSDVELPAEDVKRLEVLLEGDRGAHTLTLDVEAERASGSLALAGSLADNFDWDGRLERGNVAAAGQQWRLDGPAGIQLDVADQRARIAAHCWRHEGATLCATEPVTAGASGDATVALEGFDLAWLSPWLPPGVELEGQVAADLAARWGESRLPVVTLETGVDDGRLRIVDTQGEVAGDEPDLELSYERLGLRLDLDEDRLQTAMTLRASELGAMDLSASAGVEAGDEMFGPLTGNVDIRAVQLGVLEPFFPELRTLRGTLSAEGRLAGDVTAPSYYGTVSLDDGRLEPAAIGMDIVDIDLELLVDGDSATLDGGFRSGDGTASVTGEADWADDLSAALNLTGSGLQVIYTPLANVRVAPDIDVTFADGTLSLGGDIAIPRGEITLAELPESAVSVSDDVVIVDDQPDDEAETGDEGQAPAGAPDGLTLETGIQLTLGERVDISGYGITGRLTGDLRLEQSGGDVPQGFGEIRIEDGEYRAYGQRLQIREGQLLFSGPLDRPQLYVEAVRQIERDEVTAGLRLEGNPDEPRVSLFSEPAMPEEDILSYIVLGRPAGATGPGEENMMARAAVALGVAGGGRYATAIADELGIEDFSIDTKGDGEDTQVVVGGFINPNLYLGYGVGVFTPVNTLTLRYQLATNLFLEAVTGLESAIDLLYRFEFG